MPLAAMKTESLQIMHKPQHRFFQLYVIYTENISSNIFISLQYYTYRTEARLYYPPTLYNKIFKVLPCDNLIPPSFSFLQMLIVTPYYHVFTKQTNICVEFGQYTHLQYQSMCRLSFCKVMSTKEHHIPNQIYDNGHLE